MEPSAAPAQPVNPLTEPNWNHNLAGHRDLCFFHLQEWARVLQETYSYAPCYFTLKSEGRLLGVLPLMEVDSWLTGRRGLGLPFTDFCSPLAPDAGSLKQLLDAATAYGAGRRWKYLELRGGRGLLPSARASQTYYCHELNLVPDEQQLAAACKSSVRRAIRKAEKLGLRVTLQNDMPALRAFYSLQCRTRRKHGLPPQPFRFFLKLHEHILSREKGVVALARRGERAVAGAVFLHFGDQATFKYGASDEALQGLRANDLVMWEAIKHYAARGFKTLNLGRTSVANAGLRRFKLAWGAQEHLLEYLRYDFESSTFVAGKDEAFGWYNRVFRLLPTGLSRLVGSLAYRHAA